MQLDELLDRLYQVPLSSFIEERKAAARALEESGQKEEAQAVARLKKPNVVGWVVNRLALGDQDGFASLVEAGEAQRLAQQEGDVAGIAAAGASRRAAIEALMKRASEELEASSYAAALATMQKIERTLETVAVHGRSGLLDPAPGRLERELEPPGFEVLATLQKMPASLPETKRVKRTKKSAKAGAPKRKAAAQAQAGVSSKGTDQQARARALATRRVMVEKRLQRARAKDREEQERLQQSNTEARAARKEEERLTKLLDRAKRTRERSRTRLADQQEKASASKARVAELELELERLD